MTVVASMKDLREAISEEMSKGLRETNEIALYDKFDRDVRDYANSWIPYRVDMFYDSSPGDFKDVSVEAAIDFFRDYPLWKGRETLLGMSNAEIKSRVAKSVYDVLMTGKEV